MATPKSALRVGMANFSTGLRNPFTSSLFSLTAPATLKRKVAFNEEVYIQEILDIRDPQIHWDEARDAIDPASVPLPDSPAVSRSVSSISHLSFTLADAFRLGYSSISSSRNTSTSINRRRNANSKSSKSSYR